MMNLSALKIDPEFQGKIPPLNAEEEHILEQNMIQERRLLNPLIIWNGYILDGHSRYRILKHHPEIAFEVKEIQLPDRYAALAWICQNQLGRRNLDPERRKFLMGKTYENEKLSVGGSTHREHDESGKLTSCRQNVHMRSFRRSPCMDFLPHFGGVFRLSLTGSSPGIPCRRSCGFQGAPNKTATKKSPQNRLVMPSLFRKVLPVGYAAT